MNPLASRIWQHGRDSQDRSSASRVVRAGVIWALPWLLLSAVASHPQQWSANAADVSLGAAPEVPELALHTVELDENAVSQCPNSVTLRRNLLRRSVLASLRRVSAEEI